MRHIHYNIKVFIALKEVKMRLTHEEITFLIKGFSEFLGKSPAELRLFGSRVDD
jgi:hypothetical protein